MRLSSASRGLLVVASSLFFVAAACGDDADDTAGTGSTSPGGGSAGASGSSAGAAGKGGGSAGAAGTSAGAAGTSAGAAGTSAGAAGTSAGAAGTSAGAAGTSAGAAGTSAGAAGTSAGAAGTSAGAAGTSAGAAGSSAGSGGSSAGAGGQSVASAQCTAPNEGCTLHDDCCNCLALGPGEKAPACDLTNCKASACELLGQPTTGCHAGQCRLEIGCGAAEVQCESQPPTCNAGFVPGVNGSCWTGSCVPVRECTRVSTCDACKAAGLACVVTSLNSQFPIVNCVDLPATCDKPSCACLGPAVCTGSNKICEDTADGVTCSCPNC